jgi:hypothetical protein
VDIVKHFLTSAGALNADLVPRCVGGGYREALPHPGKKLPPPSSMMQACLCEQPLLFCLAEQLSLVLKRLFFVPLDVW